MVPKRLGYNYLKKGKEIIICKAQGKKQEESLIGYETE